jgi:hypothetical protein
MQLDLVKQLFGNKSKTMSEYQNNIPMQSWCEDDKPGTKLLMKGKAAVSDSESPVPCNGNTCSGSF